MSHRGPDGSGFFSDDHATLGHRRLSIIDLAGGDQPIFNEDRSVVVVFNGEIYNYKELRRDLIRRGHTFATESDTEVLVHLYEEKGTSLVDDLNGMFAFALWDTRRQILFAARDRMGEKPFYYRQTEDGTINFASELKALIAVEPNKPKVSISSIHEYLSYGYVPAPATIFDGIYKLPAAHRLIWRQGDLRVERYWSPRNEQPAFSAGFDEAAAELETLLRDSVKLRLRSDVPVGAFLSGGIDSSLIVALASDILDKPLKTFVVGFEESRFDESAFAAEVAGIFGTDHQVINVNDLSLDILPELVRQFDEPFADPSSLPTYYVTRAAGDELKVCLSGDGGDELFCGYTRYFSSTLEQVARRLPPGIRKSVFGNLAPLLPNFVPGVGLAERLALDGAEHYQKKMGIFGYDERKDLLRKELCEVDVLARNQFDKFFDGQPYSDMMSRVHADQETYLPEDILVKVDRNSMLHSLEVRVPLIDHRVVDFANALPESFKVEGSKGKRILRSLLARHVPKRLIDRPKQGFTLPIRDWFRRDYATELESTLLTPDSQLLAYLNKEAIQQEIDIHGRGLRDRSHQLWALLWLEVWLREVASPIAPINE